MSKMWKNLKAYCKGHNLDKPKSWHYSFCFWRRYAVSLHVISNDRWEELDANVVLLLDRSNKKYRQNKEERLIGKIVAELIGPILLTLPMTMSVSRKSLLKDFGLTLMPVRWAGNGEDEYEVYLKGQMEMGPFANLMERVEFIGKEIVYSDSDGK